MMGILAGRVARLQWVFTTATPPGAAPTAIVCVTRSPSGALVETLDETVVVDGTTVTVTAEWTIPDEQHGGLYYATVDLSGSVVDADQTVIDVDARVHTEPHPA